MNSSIEQYRLAGPVINVGKELVAGISCNVPAGLTIRGAVALMTQTGIGSGQ
jgi:hypothetical protein